MEIDDNTIKDLASDSHSPELLTYVAPGNKIRKNWVPTENDYDLVYKLCIIGMQPTRICWLLNVNPDSFKNRVKKDERLQLVIEKGREMGVYSVTKTVFDMIVKDKSETLAKFFLKCKAGWKEEGEQTIVFNQLNVTPENYDEMRARARRYSESLDASRRPQIYPQTNGDGE